MYNSSLLVIQKLFSTNAYLGHRIPTSDFQGYLYGFRNEMAIINLEKTLICLRRACNLIEFIIRAKGHFLLVNTNLEYNKIIQQMVFWEAQMVQRFKHSINHTFSIEMYSRGFLPPTTNHDLPMK
jgi:ribosomal protein S2